MVAVHTGYNVWCYLYHSGQEGYDGEVGGGEGGEVEGREGGYDGEVEGREGG